MALRYESIPEPVNPIVVQDCSWCEKDESWVPLHECLSCQHSRQDAESTWCSWETQGKLCEGCGIPAEHCEPRTCMILQAIKKRPKRPLSKTTC
jgi:hypothetical protein